MSGSNQRHILVVAGDYDIVEQAQTALNDKRLAIHKAFNHRDAMFSVQNEQFDLIMVDASMTDRHTNDSTINAVAEILPKTPLIAFLLNDSIPLDPNLPSHKTITTLDNNIIHHSVFDMLHFTQSDLQHTAERMVNMNAALERRLEEIQALSVLGKSLAEVLDLHELLNRVVEAARRLTNAEEGMILLPDEEGSDALYLRARVGFDVEVARNFRIRTTDSIAGQVFKSGHPTLIGAQGPQKVKTEYFVNSLLYVPILLKGKSIGVLGVNNRTTTELFDLNHQQLLRNLASYAAIAIENARIHEETLQRARELETLVNASQVVNSSLALEETLPNICQQLARVMNVNHTEIYEWDREYHYLRTLARHQRSVWQIGEGPRVRLKRLQAFRAAIENDTFLWIGGSDTSMSTEAVYTHQVGASAMLLIPICTEEKALGAIQAFYIRQPNEESFTTVMQHVRRLALESLVGIMGQVIKTTNDTIFRPLEAIKHLLDADWCQLSLFAAEQDALIGAMEIGNGVWLQEPQPFIDLRKHQETVQLLQTQNSVVQNNGNGNVPIIADRIAARTLLAIPLIQRGHIHGLVVFADTLQTHEFRERDIDVGRAIVGQAATALENASLVHELEQRLQQLKDTQERLVETARLSAMGELAAVVAHQINNPLTTIIADAELMLMDHDETSPDFEALTAILRAGKRSASVARRLLSISRPNDPDAPPEPIDVVDTIEGVLALVQTHIERDGVRFELDFPDEALPPVPAVRGRLDDVWLNLIMNAHDALAGTPNPTISVRVVPLLDIGLIDVHISDNGPGIPEKIKNEVFKPFFTTKPAGEGTGLGLHICRQTIELIGGTMYVDSGPEEGAHFRVRLPIKSN